VRQHALQNRSPLGAREAFEVADLALAEHEHAAAAQIRVEA
jgi:hypothetical protein